MSPDAPPRRPVVVGHRGAAAVAPENTVASLQAGAAAGAAWIEFDVRLSGDGHPILLHDATLDRTTSGRGPVAEWTWDRLAALDAGAWFGREFRGERIPDLDAAIRVVPERIHLLVELKAATARENALVRAVAGAMRLAPRAGGYTVSSSCWDLLRDPTELPAGTKLALVFRAGERRDPLAAARRIGAAEIHANRSRVTPALVRAARAHGIAVRAYTVDGEDDLNAMLAAGVDGVITNDPAAVRDWLEARFGPP